MKGSTTTTTMTTSKENEASDLPLLEQLIYEQRSATNKLPSSQFRRDYYEKPVQPRTKALTQEEQFLSDFDPAKYGLEAEPSSKKVKLSSKAHISQLKKTIAHLEHLKSVFKAGTANRMVVSQACGKLKHLLRRLESKAPPPAVDTTPQP
jgi:hypothetical protein